MKSEEIRKIFLNYFKEKQHKIVPSAPMVLKNDPTLMFTNAGMNQFKDIFLGNNPAKNKRVADTQKCLRVSGKHNDLEEVGHDTYHHTMFEMLGNWSFGDYFKTEAIEWAWELLTKVFNIPAERLYATIFEGDAEHGVSKDEEARNIWLKYLPEERILEGNKKDNFWEMGEQGPCGPCSEIHIDLREQSEIDKISGRELVNKDHHLVIEIWNLVFIQYNRKANGQLEILPNCHVDTGMGFERLCMVIQNKKSNYDTDVFQPIIKKIGEETKSEYNKNKETDIAMRVVADHLRTIAFAIADGQLPSNNKAGYVIRRILRRAVRYSYTFLNKKEAYMYKLIDTLTAQMGEAYPELKAQENIIKKVLKQEEEAFLKTLETGIKLLDKTIKQHKKSNKKIIGGAEIFELYDTFGFPPDLTDLIVKEQGFSIDYKGFEAEMEKQKNRARNASALSTNDWIIPTEDVESKFVGYDKEEIETRIVKYRKVEQKKKTFFQIVLKETPFYAESGGQIGDTGLLISGDEKIGVEDTKKENNLTIHITKKLPSDINKKLTAKVNIEKRIKTTNNHSATHLLHAALREVLGTHVEQRGSLVTADYLRFDFSHFSKVTEEELGKVEKIVNERIRQNIKLEELREININDAKEMGATALFGEKYGDKVRVIISDRNYSIELCGGTHVKATGQIGLFKITAESAIAAGIRRIECISGEKAEKFVTGEMETLNNIRQILKAPKKTDEQVLKLLKENNSLKKQIENFEKEKLETMKLQLAQEAEKINNINVIATKVNVSSTAMFKDLSFMLKDKIDNLFCVLGAELNGKANISIMISKNLVEEKNLNAGKIIREVSKEIQGGGGGQAFFATAGGRKTEGIETAIKKAVDIIKKDN